MNFLATALALALAAGETASTLNDRAVQLLEEDRFDEAIVLLEQAILLLEPAASPQKQALTQNLAMARNNRGVRELKDQAYARAAADFDAAVLLAPDSPLFQVHLGYAHVLLRDYPRAEAVLLAVRQRFPTEPKTYEFLGFLYYCQDDLKKAVDMFEARLSIAGDAWTEDHLARARRELAVSGDFVDRSSADFTLKFLGDGKNGAIADEVLQMLQAARARVGSDLGHFPPVRTTVLLYTDQDFRKATGAHGWVGGLYDGKIRLPVRDFARQRESIAATIRHEYTHRVLADLAPGCPIWVNEGLAEWYEREGQGAHDAIVALRKEGADPTRFAAMPSSWSNQNDAAAVRVQYAAAESFLAFLRDRFGLGAVRQFVEALGQGDSVDEAMRPVFGGALAEIEELWRREILP